MTKETEAGKKIGRPTLYTDELAKEVCATIETENESLVYFSKKYAWFPHRDTLVQWRKENKMFSDMYMESKKRQALLTDDSLKEKAEEMMSYAYEDKDGNKKIDSGIVSAYSAIFRNIQWGGVRLQKGIYGDSIEHTGTVTVEHEMWLKEAHDKLKQNNL